MTKSQFIAQKDTLQQQLSWWEIVVDKEIFSDFAIGCFLDEDTKTWKVYMNHERGWHSIRLVTESLTIKSQDLK